MKRRFPLYFVKQEAAYLNYHMRRNFLNSLPRRHVYLFAVCAVYFCNEANQTDKVFDPEKRAPSRDGDEWILWPNDRPLKWHRGFTSFRVNKENTVLIRKSSYAIDFKLNITIWMKRVNDLEGFVVKVLIGCS